MRCFFILSLVLLMGCQTREYEVIENHRASDDSFIECAHNEYQKMEEKRLRKKEPKKN
jgi:hypothetical protein